MNEFSNGFSAMPEGFSAASIDELDRVEGGHDYLDFSSYKAMYYSIANHCKDLARWAAGN